MRKHVSSLAENIEELSFGGANAKFKKKVREAEAIVEKGESDGQHKEPKEKESEEDVNIDRELNQSHPDDRTQLENPIAQNSRQSGKVLNSSRGVLEELLDTLYPGESNQRIILAFQQIEQLLIEIAPLVDLPAEDIMPRSVVTRLFVRKKIRSSTYRLYKKLNEARDVAIHSKVEISKEEARSYALLANDLSVELEILKSKLLNQQTPK